MIWYDIFYFLQASLCLSSFHLKGLYACTGGICSVPSFFLPTSYFFAYNVNATWMTLWVALLPFTYSRTIDSSSSRMPSLISISIWSLNIVMRVISSKRIKCLNWVDSAVNQQFGQQLHCSVKMFTAEKQTSLCWASYRDPCHEHESDDNAMRAQLKHYR